MASVMRLLDIGAFDEAEDPCPGEQRCEDGSCGGVAGCGCAENAEDPICLSLPDTGDQPPGTEGFSCADLCAGAGGGPVIGEGMVGTGGDYGGMSCPDACAAMGGSTYFDPSIFEWQDRVDIENELGCTGGMEWNFDAASWQCSGGGGEYNPCEGVVGECNYDLNSGIRIDALGNPCPEGC
jgi:hypothetical protein